MCQVCYLLLFFNPQGWCGCWERGWDIPIYKYSEVGPVKAAVCFAYELRPVCIQRWLFCTSKGFECCSFAGASLIPLLSCQLCCWSGATCQECTCSHLWSIWAYACVSLHLCPPPCMRLSIQTAENPRVMKRGCLLEFFVIFRCQSNSWLGFIWILEYQLEGPHATISHSLRTAKSWQAVSACAA